MQLSEKAKMEVEASAEKALAVNKIIIIDDKTLEEANNLLTIAVKAEKEIEKRRKSIVDPINKQLKEINGFFKKYSEPLKSLIGYLKSEVLRYQQAKRLEESKEAREFADALGVEVEETRESIKLEGAAGTVQSRLVWTFKIADKLKVPSEYLIVDEKKVREAIRNGIREIEGIEIYQEEKLAVS